jgi:hypothetical protein
MVVERRLTRALCADDETLAQLIDGFCDDATRPKVLAHLERCLLCSNAFVESQRFVHVKQRFRRMSSSFPSASS